MARTYDPTVKSLAGRIGAHSLHSRHDSRELTRNARAAFRDKFEREVDPDGVLTPQERARRAEHARKAYYGTLALRRWQTQKRKKGDQRDEGK